MNIVIFLKSGVDVVFHHADNYRYTDHDTIEIVKNNTRIASLPRENIEVVIEE